MTTLNQFWNMRPEAQRRFVASLTREQQAALARDAFAVAKRVVRAGGVGGVGFSFGGLLSGLQSIASVAAPVLSVAVPGAGPILGGLTAIMNTVTAGAQAFATVRNAINPPRAAAAPAPTPQQQQQAPAKDNTGLYIALGAVALLALGGRR